MADDDDDDEQTGKTVAFNLCVYFGAASWIMIIPFLLGIYNKIDKFWKVLFRYKRAKNTTCV